MLANEWDVSQLQDWGLDIDQAREEDPEKDLIEDVVPDIESEEIFVKEGDVFQL